MTDVKDIHGTKKIITTHDNIFLIPYKEINNYENYIFFLFSKFDD